MANMPPKQQIAERVGLALVALAFLWRLPAGLVAQGLRDGGIIIATWPDTPWVGALVMAVCFGVGLWPVLRLSPGLWSRLGLALLWAVLLPILLRTLLTGSTDLVALGLQVGRTAAWLWAAALLAATALAARRWGGRMVPWFALLWGLALAAGSVYLYYRGPISTSDIYLYQQMLWSSLHGPAFAHVAEEGGCHFAVHNSPALLLLLPIYALWPSGVPLVVLQAAAAALALPLAYRLLAPRVGERWAALGMVGFALLPGVLGPAFGKFHETSFALPLLLGAVLALEQGRGRRFAACCLGLGLLRETFGLVVAILGVGAWLSRRRRWGAAALAAGLGWLALSYLVVMPACVTPGTRTPYRELYGQLGATPGAMVRTAASRPALILHELGRPANRIWADQLSSPFGALLPLCHWQGWLAAGEVLTITAARSGTPWPVRDLFCHYTALISAALWLGLVGALAGAGRRWGWSRRVLGAALAASLLFAAAATLPMVPATLKHLEPGQAAARTRLLARLPAGAEVAAPYDVLPFVAHRRTAIYNSGHQPATRYLVSLRGQDYQRPAQGYRQVGRYGPYTLWEATGRE